MRVRLVEAVVITTSRPAWPASPDGPSPAFAVLGEERLLEGRLTADEVEQLVASRRPDDRA